MKRILLSIILPLFAFLSVNAQNVTISGKVTDQGGTNFLSGVEVAIKSLSVSTKTDSEGKFILANVPGGNYDVQFSIQDYGTLTVTVSAKQDVDMGSVAMKSTEGDIIVEISDDEISDDEGGGQNVSGILHGSRDAFMSIAGYTLGPLRFRVRGYSQGQSSVYMNGIIVNDLASDRISWSNWGGLNRAVWNKETYKGLDVSDFSFGNIGGVTNINTRASTYRPGTEVSYASTNRSYRNRVMFTHATGLMENGWAVTVSGSHRWAEEGYVEGTNYDAYAYFLSLEKQLNDKHSINLTAFGAPTTRASQGGSTQEVYDLTGNNYYNPYWGWQDGEKRNSRIKNYHKPMAILTDYWTINNKTSLETSASYSFGTYGSTALNWYNASDPRPDYYRYLPSYFDENPVAAQVRADEFANGERQLDWNQLYQTNYNGFTTIEDANGIEGNTQDGLKSEYIIEDRRNDEQQYVFNTVLSHEINDNIKINSGFVFRHFTGHSYKLVDDLLGGDFIVDIDKYAERDLGGGEVAQSDIRTPNRVVGVGDVFGYDYNSNIRYTELWAQAKFNYNKIDFVLAAQGAYTGFWRTGNMQNGKFPNNSLGDSETVTFIDYGAKANVVYKLSGKHYFRANAAYITKAPNFNDAYVSLRTRDQLISNLTSEVIYSVDAGYVLRTAKVKATFDVFYTKFENQSWIRSFYHDGYRAFVNYAMTGIDKVHQGMELGLEAAVTSTITVTAAGSVGYYRWDSNPTVDISIDNSSEVLAQGETVYAENFLVSGTPQSVGSVGVKYRSPKYWFAGVNFNYLQDRFLSFNPVRRTSEAIEFLDPEDQQYQDIVFQEELPSGYTADLFIGKSWRINRKYYINLSLNVSNILDNQDLITGGYEQLRFDERDRDVEKYAPKYFYGYGRSYFLNASFRF